MLALHPFKRPNLLGARMRDFERPGRSEAFGLSAMAATSHPSATLAAIDVLRAGGNAVDAAIAAAALLAVIEPTQTGIGGDCFVLLKRTGEPIVAMNGSGPAARAEDADRLLGLGLCELDPESAHVVTVPGAVRAWERLAKDHGTLGWDRLFAPAIAAAEAGYPVTERLARDWGRQIGKLARHPATASVFLPNGASPAVGDIHRQPALGRTLRDIARQGADVFYEGWIAEDIVSTLGKLGAFIP